MGRLDREDNGLTVTGALHNKSWRRVAGLVEARVIRDEAIEISLDDAAKYLSIAAVDACPDIDGQESGEGMWRIRIRVGSRHARWPRRQE